MTQMEALEQWISAKSNLEEAASRFLLACTTLKNTTSQSFSVCPNEQLIEEILQETYKYSDSLSYIQGQMEKSRRVLNALPNLSTSRVPISKLPAEILSRIFAICVASSSCTSSYYIRNALLDLPLVCARWYQIAITTPALWTHIDLQARPIPANQPRPPRFGRTKLYLNRSRGLRIHFHLPSHEYHVKKDQIPELISILQPYSSAIGSLELHGQVKSDSSHPTGFELTQALLSLLHDNGAPVSLQTLVVSGLHTWSPNDVITWPASVALSELNLQKLEGAVCPSLSDIVMMLSNCPTLHTLRLWNLRIKLGPQQEHHSPVQLPCLKLLDLNDMGPGAIPALASVLFPGTLQLDVRLDLRLSNADWTSYAVQSLLSRSNVIWFTIRQIRPSQAIGSYLAAMPHLQVLVVDLAYARYSTPIIDALIEYIDETETNEDPLCLQALGFKSGHIESELMSRIKKVVEGIRLHNLFFMDVGFSTTCGQPPLQYDDMDPDEQYNMYQISDPEDVYTIGLPKDAAAWFRTRVDKLTVYDHYPDQINQGVDRFIRHLANVS